MPLAVLKLTSVGSSILALVNSFAMFLVVQEAACIGVARSIRLFAKARLAVFDVVPTVDFAIDPDGATPSVVCPIFELAFVEL